MAYHKFKDLEEFKNCSHDYKVFKRKDRIDRWYCPAICKKCFRFTAVKKDEKFLELPELTDEVARRCDEIQNIIKNRLQTSHSPSLFSV